MVDCGGFIQPLNLECILVNTMVDANILLFVGIALALIAFGGAYFRMNGLIMISFIGLFIIFLSTYNKGLYVLIMIIIALIIAGLARKPVTAQ